MRKRGKKSKPRSPEAKAEAKPDIDRLFDEGVEIDRAFDRAIREALRMHKRAGNPVPIWKNDRVVWIPPHEIPVS